MVKIKEKEQGYSQWQEVVAFPKPQQNWRLSSKREERKFYDARKVLPPSSTFVETSVPVRSLGRYTRPLLESSSVQPHQERVFWFFDTQKPKSGPNLRNNLIEAARDIYTTQMPLVSGQAQEQVLLTERYALLEFEYTGTLSNAQAERLHEIEAQLDQLEDRDLVEQEADRRLAQTSDKLDEILLLLRSLPRKTLTKEDAKDMIL